MNYGPEFKITNVVSTRPNSLNIAALMPECKKCPEIALILVHTGHHYDEKMSESFFEQL
jgi:UDP-N-acetylglucosamine 2-epimerase